MLDHKRNNINIETPPHAESEYFRYNRVHTIVLMAVMRPLWSASVLLVVWLVLVRS